MPHVPLWLFGQCRHHHQYVIPIWNKWCRVFYSGWLWESLTVTWFLEHPTDNICWFFSWGKTVPRVAIPFNFHPKKKTKNVIINQTWILSLTDWFVAFLSISLYEVSMWWPFIIRIVRGGPERVRLIVDSTTISNLFYNLQSAPKSTIYNLQATFGKNLQEFGQKKM